MQRVGRMLRSIIICTESARNSSSVDAAHPYRSFNNYSYTKQQHRRSHAKSYSLRQHLLILQKPAKQQHDITPFALTHHVKHMVLGLHHCIPPAFRCLMDLQCLWLVPVGTQSERFTSQSALIWLGGSALAARSIFTTLVELIPSSD